MTSVFNALAPTTTTSTIQLVPPTAASTDIPFPNGVTLAMTFVVLAASVSCLAVVSLLIYIAYYIFKDDPRRRWHFGTHVHYYFLNLLVFDLISCGSGIIILKWKLDAKVTEGALCTTQAIMEQIGNVGVAQTTLAIAVHTFATVALGWEPAQSNRIPFVVISTIWMFSILNITVNAATHKGEDYWGDTQYWCWVTQRFPVQRILLEYLWMWFAALLNFLLYIPLTLVIQGWIEIRNKKVNWTKRHSDRFDITKLGMDTTNALDSKSIARSMLLYPVIYTITVLPVAIVRWIAFDHKNVPFAATIVADVIFSLQGLFDVVVFSITRPGLVPRPPRRRSPSPILPELSFSAPSNANEITTTFEVELDQDSEPGQSDLDVEDKHEKSFSLRTLRL